MRLFQPYEDLGGAFRSARESQDFVIDGESLGARVEGGSASRLGWSTPGEARDLHCDQQVVDKLLLRGEPDFPDDRYALYVCSECADFGCGAVTAVIERQGELIVWRDFGWQANYEETVYRDAYRHIGPFHFDSAEYERVLRRFLKG